MSRRSFAASLGLAAMLMSANAFADVIVQNLGGPALGVETSGGPDDVTFIPPSLPFISQPFTTPSFEITDFPTSLGGVSANFTVSSAVSAAVPEPSTWAMMLAGFGLLGLLGYRKTRGALA
jgi:PEP-CTERM motif